MHKLNTKGTLDALLIPFIVLLVISIGLAGFGFWAYMERQDYKDNVDQKIAAAVEVAKKEEASAKDNEFLEKEKLPFKDYNGPTAYGSVAVKYPKTWSAYSIEGQGGNPIDAYFHPGFVPYAQDANSSFALRLQVSQNSYDQELQQFDALVKAGKITVTPLKLALVPSVTGVRLDGQIFSEKQGSMVLFAVRDKTLKVWTEGNQYVGDFDNNILPNLSFAP